MSTKYHIMRKDYEQTTMFERILFILAVQLIWQPKGGHRIIHKRIHFTYIAGGWISGKIISPKRNSLFKQQSTSLVSLIKSCHFFTLSSIDTIHNRVMTNKGNDEFIAYFAIFLLFWLVKGLTHFLILNTWQITTDYSQK